MATSTRDRLLDSALQRFADDGVLATTLDQVREGAGASVGAVYHHFPDKEALYEAVRARALADYQAGYAAELERHADAEAGVAPGPRAGRGAPRACPTPPRRRGGCRSSPPATGSRATRRSRRAPRSKPSPMPRGRP